jgi:hypothetical protein
MGCHTAASISTGRPASQKAFLSIGQSLNPDFRENRSSPQKLPVRRIQFEAGSTAGEGCFFGMDGSSRSLLPGITEKGVDLGKPILVLRLDVSLLFQNFAQFQSVPGMSSYAG